MKAEISWVRREMDGAMNDWANDRSLHIWRLGRKWILSDGIENLMNLCVFFRDCNCEKALCLSTLGLFFLLFNSDLSASAIPLQILKLIW